MDTQDPNATYTILITERQRHYMHLALSQFIANDPGEELDEWGQDIPTVLTELLSNDPSNPLGTTGLNSFVL